MTPVNSMVSVSGLQTWANIPHLHWPEPSNLYTVVRHFLPNTDRLIPRIIWAKAIFPKEGHTGVDYITGPVRK